MFVNWIESNMVVEKEQQDEVVEKEEEDEVGEYDDPW